MNTSARQGTTLPFKRGIGPIYAVSTVIAILVSIVSFAGFFFPPLVYPSDELRRTFVPNDLANLVLGVPALLFSLWLAYHRRWLGVFFWAGALVYVLYNCLAYLFAMPLSLPFLIYLVLVMLSLYALIELLANLDGELVRQRLHHNVPEKFAAAVLMGLGSIFFLRALGVMLTSAVGRNAIPRAELAVNIADFLVTPAWVIGGFLLWRKSPLGYVVGLGLLFQASLLFIALIIVMIYKPVLTEAPLAFTDLAVIFTLGLICFIPFVGYARGAVKQEDRRDS